jgi:hypothetical protein
MAGSIAPCCACARETAIPGLPYSLYRQKRAANLLVKAKAARAQSALKAIGLDSEFV